MTPDFQNAAVKATETLIKYRIDSAPVSPMPIIKKQPGVLVLSFLELSSAIGVSRDKLVSICGESNQDAVTTIQDGRYLVAYNQKLPYFVTQRALARELAHIVLGHDGSRPEDVRDAEARCFAHHLLCPRALIHQLQVSCIRITSEVIGNLTGCYDNCLISMRRMPGVNVPAELNRQVRDQFMEYTINYFKYQRSAALKDVSAIADLGTYMDGYEE